LKITFDILRSFHPS